MKLLLGWWWLAGSKNNLNTSRYTILITCGVRANQMTKFIGPFVIWAGVSRRRLNEEVVKFTTRPGSLHSQYDIYLISSH